MTQSYCPRTIEAAALSPEQIAERVIGESEYICDGVPDDAIEVGIAAWNIARHDLDNYVSGETTDWDEGMIVAAIYKAVRAALPVSPVPTPSDAIGETVEKLREGIEAVRTLIEHSHGVAGLHLNGDVAPWDSLRTGGQFEPWLLAFDDAIRAIPTLLTALEQRGDGESELVYRVRNYLSMFDACQGDGKQVIVDRERMRAALPPLPMKED